MATLALNTIFSLKMLCLHTKVALRVMCQSSFVFTLVITWYRSDWQADVSAELRKLTCLVSMLVFRVVQQRSPIGRYINLEDYVGHLGTAFLRKLVHTDKVRAAALLGAQSRRNSCLMPMSEITDYFPKEGTRILVNKNSNTLVIYISYLFAKFSNMRTSLLLSTSVSVEQCGVRKRSVTERSS